MPMMKHSRWATLLLMGLATHAGAQTGVGFTEMSMAPVAKDWEARSERLHHAQVIELRARVTVNGKSDRWIELVHTTSGTVGCLVVDRKPCEPLRQLGLVDVPVDRLLNFLVAQSPQGPQPQALPGAPMCWALPNQQREKDVQATFSDWSFNPEAGMPMPGGIALRQGRVSVRFEIERFLLRAAPDQIANP
jgi:hypothetical protein